ncbi:MAG: hypothetical protein AB2990_01635 [Candidatus Symbiodolus clandestinus]
MPTYLCEGGASSCGGPICLSILAGRQAADKEGLDRLFNSGTIFPSPSPSKENEENKGGDEKEKKGTGRDGKDINKKKEKENPDPSNKQNPEDAGKFLEEGVAQPMADRKSAEQGGTDKNSSEEKTKRPDTTPTYAACWSTDKGNEVSSQIRQWWNSTKGCHGGLTIPELGYFCVPADKRAERAFSLAVCPVTLGNDKVNAGLDRLFNSGEVFPTPDACSRSKAAGSSGTAPQYAACWSTGVTKKIEAPQNSNYFLSQEFHHYEENKQKDEKRGLEWELIEQAIGKTIDANKKFSSYINKPEVKLANAVSETLCESNTICQAGVSFLDTLGTLLTMTSSKEAFEKGKYSQTSAEILAGMNRRQRDFEEAEEAQKESPYIFEFDSRFRERHREEGEAVQRDKIKRAAWAKRGLSERIKQERQDSIVSYNETLPPMKYSPELYKDTPHIYRNLPKLLQEPACELLFMGGSLLAAQTGPVGIAAALGVNYARNKTIEEMNNRVANDEKHNVLVDDSRAAAMYIKLDKRRREQQKSHQFLEPATGSLKQSISSVPEASTGSEVTPSKAVGDTTDLSFSSSPLQKPRDPTAGARP